MIETSEAVLFFLFLEDGSYTLDLYALDKKTKKLNKKAKTSW